MAKPRVLLSFRGGLLAAEKFSKWFPNIGILFAFFLYCTLGERLRLIRNGFALP